ncbi:hypothetical protein ACSBR1_009385 [Camellia fascicularis]
MELASFWDATDSSLPRAPAPRLSHRSSMPSRSFLNFPKGPKFLKIFDFLGGGIFNSDSDLWTKQRKLAQLQLSHPRFHQFLAKTTQDKVEKGLIKVLEHVSKQGLVVDFQDLFRRLTFDTTCILVTGYDPGCLSIDLPHVPFSKAMDDAEEAIFIRHIVPERVWKFQRINYQILDRGSYGEDHFTAEFGTVCSPCFRHILEGGSSKFEQI